MRSKKKKVNSKENHDCIIHFSDIKEEKIRPITQEKLENVRQIAKLRLSQPAGSSARFTDICEKIPETVSDGDGYHSKCYQRFSSHLDSLEKPEGGPSEDPQELKLSSRNRELGDKIKFKKDCKHEKTCRLERDLEQQ